MLGSLPVEMQIRVLLLLDADDIINCRAVSKTLCAVIDDSIAIQYQLELSAAGMADMGGLPDLSVSERLSRLRTYEEAWHSNPMVYRPLLGTYDPDDCEEWWLTTGGTIPYTAGGTLRLFRPPSASRGVPERIWTLKLLDAYEEHVTWISVDLAQDLMVLARLNEGEDGDAVDVCLCSVKRDDASYPLATQSVLAIRFNSGLRAMSCDTFVFGDLVGCTIRGTVEHMMVYNWKTGVRVWSYYYSQQAYFYIIDSSKLILVEGYSMKLYSFDPTSTSCRDLVATDHHELCELGLPPLADPDANASVTMCEAQPAPAEFMDCNPIFSNDPSSGLIAALYEIDSYTTIDTAHDRSFSWTYLLILLPVRTLLSQANSISRHQALTAHEHKLPWDAWGPDGTRCLLLDDAPRNLSAIGSKCAMFFPRDEDWDEMADILIVDARPWIHLTPSYYQSSSVPHLIDPSSYSECEIFASPLRSTLPYRIMHKEIHLGQDSSFAEMVLLEDGLAVHCTPSYGAHHEGVSAGEEATGLDAGFDFLFT